MTTRARRPRRWSIALALAATVAAWWIGYQRTTAAGRDPLTANRGESTTTNGDTTNGSAVRYRDGTYTGWGRRRHGGVEATVVIRRGRIAQTTISLCDTRYPCSYIEPLPPQAVARNSAEVDAISGATESSDAFAKAVADALKKAERPRRVR